MAAHERLSLHTSSTHHTLTDNLAKVLTQGVSIKLYHVSTPPSRASALYSAPPGERPDRTYCESHFLAVSIRVGSISVKDEAQTVNEVLVFALEVLIYSTAYSTTFFISKADSTGYLCLLKLPQGSPSPLKDISATFLSYLIGRRKRQGVRTILSLFARAQGQYLFPGSSDNKGKHVLDDRGLIKWWCRVLNPLVDHANDAKSIELDQKERWRAVRGYLKVPGLDDHDIKSYLPLAKASSVGPTWNIGHPLQDLSRYETNMPPRCLVPRFPDDPKSRFLDELDDELSTSRGKAVSGEWRSVKSLDQFWEMMAFRQECSAGRLVGFIWLVFEPLLEQQSEDLAPAESQTSTTGHDSSMPDEDDLPHLPNFLLGSSTPKTYFAGSSPIKRTSPPHMTRTRESANMDEDMNSKRSGVSKKKKLTGPIIPRQPRIKTQKRMYALEIPEKTPYYIWPSEARGQVVLDEKDYKRMHELLLRLDFTNVELACGSTERWINEVRSGLSINATSGWGTAVIGTRAFEIKSEHGKLGVRTLNVGLVRKKRKATTDDGNGIHPA